MVGSLEVVIKRIAPNILLRIHNGLAFGFSAFVVLAGLFFAINPPQQNSFWVDKIQTIGIIALIGLFVAYFRGKQKLLPDIMIEELSAENNYSVSFCSQKELREADELTRPLFGKDFISSDQIEQWRLRNEKGFVQISNADGILCACFVILGLEHSFLDQFIAGRVTEHDIDSSVILPFDSMKKEDRIYISGVVVRDPGSYMGAKRARIMFWVMLEYIKMVFGLRKTRTFYGIGLTKESEKLLKTLGFQICCSKTNRKDNSNLYRINLDKKTWTTQLARVGDLSKMVSFEFEL